MHRQAVPAPWAAPDAVPSFFAFVVCEVYNAGQRICLIDFFFNLVESIFTLKLRLPPRQKAAVKLEENDVPPSTRFNVEVCL